MAQLDAVVVGAGPNGLAAAITLLREGYRVQVLESADEPGGGTRTVADPAVPGLLHDHCSAVHPFGIASPFLRSLPLEDHGLRWRHAPVAVAHPMDDGTAGVILQDLEETAAGLGEDGPAWLRMYRMPTTRFDDLAADMLGPIVRIPRHPVTTTRAGLRALLPASVAVRAFRTPRGKALFGGIAAHTIAPLTKPLTAAIAVLMGAAGHAYGWPVAEGGSQAIWKAMVSLITELGGEVVTGVHVESLAQLPASRVTLLDVTPSALAWIAGDALPRRQRSSSYRWRFGPSAFKVDYAVQGGVPWMAPAARQAGTVHLGGTFAEIAAGEEAAWQGRVPDRPFTLVAQPHVADPSRQVGDVTPLWAYCHVPHAYPGDASDLIDAQIERFAPGFSRRVVARHVTTPKDFQLSNPNLVGGDITGGASRPWQLVARPRLSTTPYRTGIEGVFLCSSSTPPGGGVHGLCGHHAARAALRLLRD